MMLPMSFAGSGTTQGTNLSATAMCDAQIGELSAIDGRRVTQEARLQLQSQILGVVARHPQVPSLDPEVLHGGGFPHVPQLAFPGPGVVGTHVGAQAPDAAQLLRHVFAQELLDRFIERPIASGQHNHVSIQLGAI
eukprot:Skav227700  [mRNA]  locus=scaffold1635:62033:65975:- [translate_table: standard]